MQTPWLNQLSSWNPQLVRELRGRLKPRSVLAAIALSMIGQMLICLVQLQPAWGKSSQEQWIGIWSLITWLLPYLLFSLGSYYIVGDITQEEKRGTLNFIRLSPRPGWQILLGKILGVPILPYLTLATLIPLHIIAAFLGQVSIGLMVSYYLMVIMGGIFCFSLALLYGLTSSGQLGIVGRQGTTAVSFGAIAFFIFSPAFMLWNTGVTWRQFGPVGDLSQGFSDVGVLYWSYLPISNTLILSHLFTIGTLVLAAGLIWRMVLRRFRQPRSTLMSKRQSYAWVAYLELLMIGFSLRPGPQPIEEWIGFAIAIYLISAMMLVLVMFAIAPQRQALLDWSRYQSKTLTSWLWADKSPMLLTMVIHLVMVYGLLIPWTFLADVGVENRIGTIIAFIGVANTLLMYGFFIQSILAGRFTNPFVWAIGGLMVWLIVPPAMLALLRLTPNTIPISTMFWTILGYPFFGWVSPVALLFTQFGLIAQWVILGGLIWWCDRTLKQLAKAS